MLVGALDDEIHVGLGWGDVVFFDVDALVGDGLDGGFAFAHGVDGDGDSFVDAGVFVAFGAAVDFGVEGLDLGFGEVEEGAGDVFAGVVDDVADAALPVGAEDGEAEAIVVEDGGFSGFEVGGAEVVMPAPFGNGAGVEIRSVSEIPHS